MLLPWALEARRFFSVARRRSKGFLFGEDRSARLAARESGKLDEDRWRVVRAHVSFRAADSRDDVVHEVCKRHVSHFTNGGQSRFGDPHHVSATPKTNAAPRGEAHLEKKASRIAEGSRMSRCATGVDLDVSYVSAFAGVRGVTEVPEACSRSRGDAEKARRLRSRLAEASRARESRGPPVSRNVRPKAQRDAFRRQHLRAAMRREHVEAMGALVLFLWVLQASRTARAFAPTTDRGWRRS